MSTIRLARHTDISALATMLTRSFDKDPFWRWVVGDGKHYQVRLARGFAVQLRHLALPGGLVWCARQHQGAALWSAPGEWQLGIWQQLRLLPDLIRITDWRHLWAVSRAVQLIQNAHPQTPHYYLQVLGVDPAYQGKGWSKPLIRSGLALADRHQQPSYLETAEESTLSLYQREGFEIVRVLDHLPGKAPPIWCMWREPQPAAER